MQSSSISSQYLDPGPLEDAPFGTVPDIRFDGQGQERLCSQGNRALVIARYLSQLRRMTAWFSLSLHRGQDLVDILAELAPDLCDILGATGLAISYGNRKRLYGLTPSDGAIAALLDDASRDAIKSVPLPFDEQSREADGADREVSSFSVVSHSLASDVPCQMLWFRGGARATCSTDREAFGWRSVSDATRDSCTCLTQWREEEVAGICTLFNEELKSHAMQSTLKLENARLRDFAAATAHDIKAPLRGISYALTVMREENFDETCVRETHQIAETSMKRLTDLTNGLLELTLIEDEREMFALTDVSKVVADVLDMLSVQIQESGARIEVGAMPILVGSHHLLLRLFLNLIGNAIKFAAKGRAPVISVGSNRCTEDRVEIWVADNGIGIAPELSDCIFQPLKRLHAQDEIEGAGLGLSIAQRIVILHRGTIRVDCDYRAGAKFLMTFPALH